MWKGHSVFHPCHFYINPPRSSNKILYLPVAFKKKEFLYPLWLFPQRNNPCKNPAATLQTTLVWGSVGSATRIPHCSCSHVAQALVWLSQSGCAWDAEACPSPEQDFAHWEMSPVWQHRVQCILLALRAQQTVLQTAWLSASTSQESQGALTSTYMAIKLLLWLLLLPRLMLGHSLLREASRSKRLLKNYLEKLLRKRF